MKAQLVAMALAFLCGCAVPMISSPFVGTWKLRDERGVAYYMRIYSNGWVAQWPNPVGTTAWSRIRGNTLLWGYGPPLRQPTLARRGPSLIVHSSAPPRAFGKVANVEPPPTDGSSPAEN